MSYISIYSVENVIIIDKTINISPEDKKYVDILLEVGRSRGKLSKEALEFIRNITPEEFNKLTLMIQNNNTIKRFITPSVGESALNNIVSIFVAN